MPETRAALTRSSPVRWLAAAVIALQLAGAGALAARGGEPFSGPQSGSGLPAPTVADPAAGVVAASAQPATEVAMPAPADAAPSAPAPAPTPASGPAPAAAPGGITAATAPPAPAPRSDPVASPAPPQPAPAPQRRPAPPAPAPAPQEPTQQDPAARVQSTFEAAVPAPWRAAIPVRFEIIEGNTSWASPDGVIQVARAHAEGSDRLLRGLLAHEYGHLVAFRYGSYEYNGAAPEGWPAYSSRPEEAWADCVSRAFTGIDDPSHGLPSCAGESLSWTSGWLGAGPGAHERTG